MQLVNAEIDQQAAENEFRHIAEQIGRDRQHQRGNGRDSEAGEAAGAAAAEIEDGAADGDAAGIARQGASQDIGEAGDVQFAFQIGLAMGGDFDAGRVEQRAGGGDEDNGNQITEQIRQGVPGIVADFAGVPRQHELVIGGGG